MRFLESLELKLWYPKTSKTLLTNHQAVFFWGGIVILLDAKTTMSQKVQLSSHLTNKHDFTLNPNGN